MALQSVKDGGSKKTVWKMLTVREKLIVVLKVNFGYHNLESWKWFDQKGKKDSEIRLDHGILS